MLRKQVWQHHTARQRATGNRGTGLQRLPDLSRAAHLWQREDARLYPRHLHGAVHLVNHALNQVQRQGLRGRVRLGAQGGTQGLCCKGLRTTLAIQCAVKWAVQASHHQAGRHAHP